MPSGEKAWAIPGVHSRRVGLHTVPESRPLPLPSRWGLGWRDLTLSLVGMVHVGKQVFGNCLACHLSFISMTSEHRSTVSQVITNYVAASSLPADHTLRTPTNPTVVSRHYAGMAFRRQQGLTVPWLWGLVRAMQRDEAVARL